MAMNILKVGSSPYYHFQSTPYTAKATNAVKLFGPCLRCRKAVQVSNLAGRWGIHSILQWCNNLRLRELVVLCEFGLVPICVHSPEVVPFHKFCHLWVRDRSHAFFDRIVAWWHEAEWKRNLKIGRPTFHFLCAELRPHLQCANGS